MKPSNAVWVSGLSDSKKDVKRANRKDRTNKKGWDYCGNAQASVDGAYQIIVACDVTAAANDKQQAVPMAQLTGASLAQAGIERPKDAAGGIEKIPGTYDRGYYSEAAAEAVEQVGFDPYMATGRQRHQAPEVRGVQRLRPPKSAWQRKYGLPQDVRCMPDGK